MNQHESHKASLKTKPAPLFDQLCIIKLNDDATLNPYSQQRAVLIKNVINQPQEMSDASNKPLHFTRHQKSSRRHDGDISVFLQKSQICPSLLSSRIINPDSHCGCYDKGLLKHFRHEQQKWKRNRMTVVSCKLELYAKLNAKIKGIYRKKCSKTKHTWRKQEFLTFS